MYLNFLTPLLVLATHLHLATSTPLSPGPAPAAAVPIPPNLINTTIYHFTLTTQTPAHPKGRFNNHTLSLNDTGYGANYLYPSLPPHLPATHFRLLNGTLHGTFAGKPRSDDGISMVNLEPECGFALEFAEAGAARVVNQTLGINPGNGRLFVRESQCGVSYGGLDWFMCEAITGYEEEVVTYLSLGQDPAYDYKCTAVFVVVEKV